jgi:hypothetical protein
MKQSQLVRFKMGKVQYSAKACSSYGVQYVRDLAAVRQDRGLRMISSCAAIPSLPVASYIGFDPVGAASPGMSHVAARIARDLGNGE